MYGLKTISKDFTVGTWNPHEITPPQVLRTVPISRELQPARRKVTFYIELGKEVKKISKAFGGIFDTGGLTFLRFVHFWSVKNVLCIDATTSATVGTLPCKWSISNNIAKNYRGC